MEVFLIDLMMPLMSSTPILEWQVSNCFDSVYLTKAYDLVIFQLASCSVKSSFSFFFFNLVKLFLIP